MTSLNPDIETNDVDDLPIEERDRMRAVRRHHRERMIARAAHSLVLSYLRHETEQQRKTVGRWYNNLAKCSCWMCGNQRSKYGPRWSERKRLAVMDADLQTEDRRKALDAETNNAEPAEIETPRSSEESIGIEQRPGYFNLRLTTRTDRKRAA